MSAAAIARLLTAAVIAVFSAIQVGATRGVVAFEWMDPAQYYQAALAVVEHGWAGLSFEVPTLFPLLPAAAVRVLGEGPPEALLGNLVAAGALAFAAHRLATRLSGHAGAGPLAAALALFGPLSLGLSQDLYIEFTLAAAVAWAWVEWGSSERFTRWPGTIGFAVAVFLASLLKTTSIVFFALPLAAVLTGHVRNRRWGAGLRAGLAGLVPLGASWAVFWFLLPYGRSYLTSLGNTTIPWMRLIGPRDVMSLASFTYYPWILVRDLLGLSSLGLAAGALGWRRLHAGLRRDLLLGLAGPVVILTLVPVKEPRHLLPLIAVLAALVAAGCRVVRGSRWVVPSLAAVAALQSLWILLPGGAGDVLYLSKGPRTAPSLERFLEARRPRVSLTGGGLPPANHPLVHLYRTSLVLEDVPANLSLGIAWRLAPALVLMAPAGGEGAARRDDLPAVRFAEPLYYALFNLYNRRCAYDLRYRVWSDEELRAEADWWVVRAGRGDKALDAVRGRIEAAGRYRFVEALPLDPGHRLAVFENTGRGRRNLRLVYEERYYRAHLQDPRGEGDLAAVLLDIAVNRALFADLEGARRALVELRGVLGPVAPEAWPRLFFEGRMVALRQMADPLLRGTWDALP